ncbi:hypothetical protein VFPFJ_02830 [Purpureocillium lilacinum]|uniref:Uncharacterized protein n=1 Tax=Purpureocillium lilacinum TaxID=33203 RepID=A0A179GN40_PURLI|nr:hypothetical protein VFPFJ_02830 [Purpureocillium lilacinum]OAQ78589.1 hypothetical protein VFPBJ_06710 [Purpureocillium lilacinum]OAQ93668.1 hypothetical protein VFPFJ_02830 [Purpureocillium lilacinum]
MGTDRLVSVYQFYSPVAHYLPFSDEKTGGPSWHHRHRPRGAATQASKIASESLSAPTSRLLLIGDGSGRATNRGLRGRRAWPRGCLSGVQPDGVGQPLATLSYCSRPRLAELCLHPVCQAHRAAWEVSHHARVSPFSPLPMLARVCRPAACPGALDGTVPPGTLLSRQCRALLANVFLPVPSEGRAKGPTNTEPMRPSLRSGKIRLPRTCLRHCVRLCPSSAAGVRQHRL